VGQERSFLKDREQDPVYPVTCFAPQTEPASWSQPAGAAPAPSGAASSPSGAAPAGRPAGAASLPGAGAPPPNHPPLCRTKEPRREGRGIGGINPFVQPFFNDFRWLVESPWLDSRGSVGPGWTLTPDIIWVIVIGDYMPMVPQDKLRNGKLCSTDRAEKNRILRIQTDRIVSSPLAADFACILWPWCSIATVYCRNAGARSWRVKLTQTMTILIKSHHNGYMRQ
jgi:hypothetical protein